MNMIFGVKDRPKFGQTILFAIQQLLAIMAATLVVPVITNGATGSTLSHSSAQASARSSTCSLRNSAARSSLAARLPSSAAWPRPSQAASP